MVELSSETKLDTVTIFTGRYKDLRNRRLVSRDHNESVTRIFTRS